MDGDRVQKLEKALSDPETLAKNYEEVKKENSFLEEQVHSLQAELNKIQAELEQSKRTVEHLQQKTVIGKAVISDKQEDRLSGLASTSANESENRGSTRQSHGALSSSTEQDNPDSSDCISLSNLTPFPHSPSEPESKKGSNNSSTSTNPPASQGKNTRTICSKPRHPKLRLPNSVQGSSCVNCDRKQEPCQRCRQHFPTSPTHLDAAQTSDSQRNERLQNEESRPRSNKSSTTTNQPASQGKNTQTNGSKPRNSELRLPDSRQDSQCVNCASEQEPCELCRQPFPSSPTYLDTCQSFDSQRNEELQNEATNSSDTLPVDVTHPEVVQERTPTPILIRVSQPTRSAGLEADHDDNKHVDGSAPEVQPVRNPQMEPTEAVCSCNSLPMDVSRPEIVPETTSTPNPVHVSQPTRFEGLEDHHDDRNAGPAPEVRIVGILEMEQTEGGRPVEDPVQNIPPTEPPEICYLYTFNNQIVQQETDGPMDEPMGENEDAQFDEPDPL